MEITAILIALLGFGVIFLGVVLEDRREMVSEQRPISLVEETAGIMLTVSVMTIGAGLVTIGGLMLTRGV